MQKQCLFHQRSVLLVRVTFISARGSTAIKSFCCFTKISVVYYLPVEVRSTSQSPCNCNQRSVLLSTVSLIVTRDHYCYPESLPFPLEVSTVIQIPCLCHQRSIIVTICHEFATRGQYCYTETLSLQLEVSTSIQSPVLCNYRPVLVSKVPVTDIRGQVNYPESQFVILEASIIIFRGPVSHIGK